MDYESELAMARRHVEKGREHIARQREIVADLERAGHSANEARDLLSTILATQALHEAHVAKLLDPNSN